MTSLHSAQLLEAVMLKPANRPWAASEHGIEIEEFQRSRPYSIKEQTGDISATSLYCAKGCAVKAMQAYMQGAPASLEHCAAVHRML